MSEKEKVIKPRGISRRQFLLDAGLLVGGATLGSAALVSACSSVTTPTTTTTAPTSPVTAPPTTTVTTPVNEYTLIVNGKSYTINPKNNWTLVYTLREVLGLTGTKIGCDRGQCGACTVLVDGMPILSCTMLAVEAADGKKQIETIEGLSDGITLSALQQAFIDNQAFQCGYCTPGFLMATKALLASNPHPTYADASLAFDGHICICGTLKWYVDTAVKMGA